MIDTLPAGYVWQQFQVIYRWFQLYLSSFETSVDDLLIPHLTEPAPYMGQALSPRGALLYITGCHPENPWGIEKRFIHRGH